MGHSKTPWKVGTSTAGKSVVFLVGDEPDHTLGPDANWIDCNTEANARRIVAAVNAMAGIDDDNVLFRRGSIGTVRKHIVTQQVQIEKLTAQRDELLAVLVSIIDLHDSASRGKQVAETIGKARAVIQKVRGGEC